MRVYAYVDGFNLFNSLLRGTPYKWLNLVRYCEHLVLPGDNLLQVRYFTAHVKGDAAKAGRQRAYLDALESESRLSIHLGQFRRDRIRMESAEAPGTWTRVWHIKEKGSDVNLASYMLVDAALDQYDCAMVVTNDTDQREPLRLVRSLDKIVHLVTPARYPRRVNRTLAREADRVTVLTEANDDRLSVSQLPDEVKVADRLARRPPGW
jgi:uncharacterized LabA/DUF88 family protein